MSWGRLSPSQRTVVAKHVASKVVYDLGAGDLALSHTLLELGAARVVAIDNFHLTAPARSSIDERIEVVEENLRATALPRRALVWLSWPTAYQWEVEMLVGRAEKVMYLGKNSGGTVCGTTNMFKRLLRRQVLNYVPHPDNTLIVYGGSCPRRKPRDEELGGIDRERVYGYTARRQPNGFAG